MTGIALTKSGPDTGNRETRPARSKLRTAGQGIRRSILGQGRGSASATGGSIAHKRGISTGTAGSSQAVTHSWHRGFEIHAWSSLAQKLKSETWYVKKNVATGYVTASPCKFSSARHKPRKTLLYSDRRCHRRYANAFIYPRAAPDRPAPSPSHLLSWRGRLFLALLSTCAGCRISSSLNSSILLVFSSCRYATSIHLPLGLQRLIQALDNLMRVSTRDA